MVKRTKVIVAALVGAALLVGGIIAASIPGAAAAKPASGPHWVTQHYDNLLIPAGSTPPTYTIGCAPGEVLAGFQSTTSSHDSLGNDFGTRYSLTTFVEPLGIQRPATIPTSTVVYTPNGFDTSSADVTVTWTAAILCEAGG